MADYSDAAWRGTMRIRFDFNNMMANRVGPEHGVAPEVIDAAAGACRAAGAAVDARRRTGELFWMDLPYQDSPVSDVLAYAASVAGQFDDFVVLGIGGSALGNIAVHNALTHPYYNLLSPEKRGGRPRVFVLDNVDPDLVAGILDTVNVKRTLFNVITKSGSTAETMSQLLIFRDQLKQRLGPGFARNIVATTDPARGDLRKLAGAEGYQTFPIPEGVGGRFSVLSAVGLVSAAMAGVDVRALLAGAAYADELCREPDVWRNPAAMNALLQYLLYKAGKPISVFMPYSQALRFVAEWYRQLWAESLGKRLAADGHVVNVGPTPLNALGVTDQHSMLQLFQEGPFDKVINFVSVERFGHEVTIPASLPVLGSAAYLGGRTLNELIAAEQRGVEIALTSSARPNCRHILPEVNAFTLGQLLYMLEVQTAIAGELYAINAFDQPGVEGGKVATYALMGRPGFDTQRQEIATLPGADARFVI